MSEASTSFDRVLRAVVVERLRNHGFTFDGRRTFRRPGLGGNIMHIVNFQLGQRSLVEKFTVNLGVFVDGDAPGIQPQKAMEYHCVPQCRERLGRLLPRRLQAFERIPVLGIFFGPKDIWWHFSSKLTHTAAELTTAMAALETYGLPWLVRMTPNPATVRKPFSPE